MLISWAAARLRGGESAASRDEPRKARQVDDSGMAGTSKRCSGERAERVSRDVSESGSPPSRRPAVLADPDPERAYGRIEPRSALADHSGAAVPRTAFTVSSVKSVEFQ